MRVDSTSAQALNEKSLRKHTKDEMICVAKEYVSSHLTLYPEKADATVGTPEYYQICSMNSTALSTHRIIPLHDANRG